MRPEHPSLFYELRIIDASSIVTAQSTHTWRAKTLDLKQSLYTFQRKSKYQESSVEADCVCEQVTDLLDFDLMGKDRLLITHRADSLIGLTEALKLECKPHNIRA
jgi:hypothetical protein